MKTVRRRRWGAAGLLAIVGLLATLIWQQLGGEVWGQGRSQPAAPQAFKSGGERSEIVLREISDTLLRIDARLERIEAAAARAGELDPAPTR